MKYQGEFTTTKNFFKSQISYNRPLSYDQWLSEPDDHKAAVLFCQFYDQITLAWAKLASVYSSEADGVSEVLQYLQKNVDIIRNNPNRFTPSYIYRVVYNCLYCLCRDPNLHKRAYENETSNIQVNGSSGDEFDLFDSCAVEEDMTASMVDEPKRAALWRMIEGNREMVIVVAELLGEEYDWTDPNPDMKVAGQAPEFEWKSHTRKVNSAQYAELLHEADLGLARSIVVKDVFTSGEDTLRKVSYEAYEQRTYKGPRKFTAEEKAKITPARRAEIIDQLKSVLVDYFETV